MAVIIRYSNPRFFWALFPKIRQRARGRRQLRFRRRLGGWGRWRDWFGQFLPPYAREVGTEALHRDDDVTFLFEPLSDACQALPIGDRRSDLTLSTMYDVLRHFSTVFDSSTVLREY